MEERGQMTDGEAAAFVLRDVYFSYGKGGDTLQAISLNLPQGGRLVLLGANGGGKSTLLKLIAGRRKAREGEVEVLGKPAFETTALALQVTLVADEWDESICYVPVRKVLSGVCTDSNVLRMPRTARLLRALGIDANLLGSNLSAISSGQRRRVQVAFGQFCAERCRVALGRRETGSLMRAIRRKLSLFCVQTRRAASLLAATRACSNLAR
eukprot:6210268-Pleurochrysis_carterae.AAC.3